MMTPQLQEALEWVNHMRTGPLQGPPIDELPKGVPGHTQECVFARALRMGIMPALKVQMNNASHMVHVVDGQALIQGGNPSAVRKVIEQFDHGNLRDLIDYDAYRKLDRSGGAIHAAQAMAKPFDKLLPQVAKFCPELQLTPSSHVEVTQSFDTLMHVVTVKNPGECPQAVQLTATMVQHMQKAMEEEMQKAMFPPMMVAAGKLVPLPFMPNVWDPVEFHKPAKSQYYAPDWAKMMQQTPEAPVKAPSEELSVV